MTQDELRAELQQKVREVCEGAVKTIEALRPRYEQYIRILDALETITPDRDLGNRGSLPAGYVRLPFGTWLIEVVNGLGGYRIR